jgi:BTB/POZ domain-containing adapter for CUL3-mediated RhoA degradation protein
MKKDDVEPTGICRVPIIATKREADRLVQCTSKVCHTFISVENDSLQPVVKLLLNRHNNKYSYTHQSDDNLLKNLELFDRLLMRFSERVLFVKGLHKLTVAKIHCFIRYWR